MLELILRPIALGRLRLLASRLAALDQQRAALLQEQLDVMAVLLEGAGHDPNALEVVSLDLDAGRLTVAPRGTPDAA